MSSELVQAWRMSNEANLYLLGSLAPAALRAAYAPRTRDVAAQFAHMHDVRLRWLGHARPALVEGAPRIEREPPPTRARLTAALKDSEQRVAAFLEECAERGTVPSWKGPPASFLSYLVAHEAHHRGLVLAALRSAGQRVPQEVVYGLWDWGKKRSLRGPVTRAPRRKA